MTCPGEFRVFHVADDFDDTMALTMKVSGFTFLRNGTRFGYPFVESIKSILPLCDEFIVSLGPCDDDTEARINAIDDARIRIIHTTWNEQMCTKGYVYGQQKNIAHFNCSGDWAFYLECDEVVHEDDLQAISRAMELNFHDDRVEALVFDYFHFYGNLNTYLWSPAWYRRAPRIIRNSIRSYSPDGLFFLVLDSNKKGRYPRAALAHANIYHYGWVRREDQMESKLRAVGKYWGEDHQSKIDYGNIDPLILRQFKGTHPAVMKEWLTDTSEDVFKPNPAYKLTGRDRKNRFALRLETVFGLELSKKHYRLIR